MSFELVKLSESVTIIRGDCLHVLPTLEGVDAVVTDPPYCSGAVGEAQRTAARGQGLRSETIQRLGWFVGDNMGTAGLAWLLRSVASVISPLLNSAGSMVFFCDWRMVSSIQPAIESAGVRYQNLIVWDKGSMGLGKGFRAQHELALHFTNGCPEYHDLGTSNVIRSRRVGADEREHQTQKPVDLLAQIIGVVACVGGIVVDPFMGSGTTGVACIRTGRKFIGIEVDPVHFATARARLERELAQPNLPAFGSVPGAGFQSLELALDRGADDGEDGR